MKRSRRKKPDASASKPPRKIRPIDYEYAARQYLRDKNPEFLRAYIGRAIIRVLMAENMLDAQKAEHVLSPTMRKALSFLRPVAKHKPLVETQSNAV